MPAKKRAVKTRQEKEREKDAAKLMIAQGESSADVAKALKINHGTLRNWISDEQWRVEIKQAKELIRPSRQLATIPQRVAYDQAKTSKTTKRLLSKSSKNVSKWIYQQSKEAPEVLYEHGSSFKAHVESADKLFKWTEEVGNQFAVAVNLSQVVNSGQIIKLPSGATIREVG